MNNTSEALHMNKHTNTQEKSMYSEDYTSVKKKKNTKKYDQYEN